MAKKSKAAKRVRVRVLKVFPADQAESVPPASFHDDAHSLTKPFCEVSISLTGGNPE